MKHKLTRRMILSFSAVLLLFSAVVGSLFAQLFASNSAAIHDEDLRSHAIAIADTIAQFSLDYKDGVCRGGGFKAYFRFIGDISRSDIWLIDEHLNPVQIGDQSPITSAPLPEGAGDLVHQALASNALCMLSADVLHMSDTLVGTPVRDAQGNALFVLLLRHPVDGVDRAYVEAQRILGISLLCALALGVLMTIALSYRFISPIHKMKAATLRMMDGRYDTSTRVRQDDELGLLAKHIDELSVRLLDAQKARADMERSQQEFFSNVSHELRTPISVLKGSLEVLSEGMITDADEQSAYLAQMLADANHMERLVGDLLELSRLRDSHFSITMEPINLHDVVQETVRFMRQRAHAKDMTITLSGDCAPFCVLGDYGRLRQLLTILLDNAVKFSAPGSDVALCVAQQKDTCVVTVADHGVGMTSEQLAHVFERFYHTGGSGSGLGLSIAKEIALRHRVDIDCSSEKDKGTCFTLTFTCGDV